MVLHDSVKFLTKKSKRNCDRIYIFQFKSPSWSSLNCYFVEFERPAQPWRGSITTFDAVAVEQGGKSVLPVYTKATNERQTPPYSLDRVSVPSL